MLVSLSNSDKRKHEEAAYYLASKTAREIGVPSAQIDDFLNWVADKEIAGLKQRGRSYNKDEKMFHAAIGLLIDSTPKQVYQDYLAHKALNKNNPGIPGTFEEAYQIICEQSDPEREALISKTWEEYARMQLDRAKIPSDQADAFLDWLGAQEEIANHARDELTKRRIYNRMHAAGNAIWNATDKEVKIAFQKYLDDKIANQDNPGVAGLFESVARWKTYARKKAQEIGVPREEVNGFLDWFATHDSNCLLWINNRALAGNEGEAQRKIIAIGWALNGTTRVGIKRAYQKYLNDKIANKDNPGVAGLFEATFEGSAFIVCARETLSALGIPPEKWNGFFAWFRAQGHMESFLAGRHVSNPDAFTFGAFLCLKVPFPNNYSLADIARDRRAAALVKWKEYEEQQLILHRDNPGVAATFEERCRQLNEAYDPTLLNYYSLHALNLLKRNNIPEEQHAGFFRWVENNKELREFLPANRRKGPPIEGLEILGHAVFEWANNQQTPGMPDAEYFNNQNKMVVKLWNQYLEYNKHLHRDNPGVTGTFEEHLNESEEVYNHYGSLGKALLRRVKIPEDMWPGFAKWLEHYEGFDWAPLSILKAVPGIERLGHAVNAWFAKQNTAGMSNTDYVQHQNKIVLDLWNQYLEYRKTLHRDNPGVSDF